MRAPEFNSVNHLNGEVVENPKFWEALAEADEFCQLDDENRSLRCRLDELEAEAAVTREAFAAAVGVYDCPCGSVFEFFEDSSLEAYAELNMWLGLHLSDDHNTGSDL